MATRWVIETEYGMTTRMMMVCGALVTAGWLGVGVSIGWWIWG